MTKRTSPASSGRGGRGPDGIDYPEVFCLLSQDLACLAPVGPTLQVLLHTCIHMRQFYRSTLNNV